MRETRITLPELMLVAGTRAAGGAGLALLLSDRLSAEQRRAVGWTLLAFGVLSTIPLALEIFGGHRLGHSDERQDWSDMRLPQGRERAGRREEPAHA
jgi:hypothetical protein